MNRPAERGFTLIELVLALTIVALMMTVLFGGLRVGLRAWQRGEEKAETLEHARSMTLLLEQTLGGVYPFQGRSDENSQPQVFFQGETEKVSFVTTSPPVPFSTPLAFTAITMSVDGGTAPGLAIREKALPNFDPFEEVAPSLIDPTVTAIRFRYLRGPDSGSWEETWSGADERAIPRAIEVTVTAVVNGQAQEQTPITVPIRVTSP
jgi:general secretion pathway protein J